MKLKNTFYKIVFTNLCKGPILKIFWQCACICIREICACRCRNELGISTRSLAISTWCSLQVSAVAKLLLDQVLGKIPRATPSCQHFTPSAGLVLEGKLQRKQPGLGAGAKVWGPGAPLGQCPGTGGPRPLGEGEPGRRGCAAAVWHPAWAVEVTHGSHNGKALFVCQRKARSWTTAAGRLCLCLKVSAGEPAGPSARCSWAAACTCRCGLYQASQRLASILGRQGSSPRLGLMGLLMLFVWSAKRCSGGWWFSPPCWVWKLQNWVAQMLGRVA